MAKKIKLVCDQNQTGLALGLLFALMHLLWVIVVGLGFGQRLADWVHSTHFLTDMHTLSSFNFATALIGIVGAFVSGYVTGWVFAWLWNWLGEKLK